MGVTIHDQITDPLVLREGYILRDGFVFALRGGTLPIMDRIVIRSPQRARGHIWQNGFSYRTLEEHIELVNKYQIEKALIISDHLDFLLDCPSLKDIHVVPSFSAPDRFDYSVLHQMPNLKQLSCQTEYGETMQYNTTIEYSDLNGLEELHLYGGVHIGFEKLPMLKKIFISQNKEIRDFSEISCSKVLENAEILQTRIQTLSGIEQYRNLKTLHLTHNYALQDISALEAVSETLEELSIDACSKLRDFSVLSTLSNLRCLHLEGNNVLPDLRFLDNMKNLLLFNFTMDVADGDLDLCMKIPYVTCRNRKHFNLKDKELPKDLTPLRKHQGVEP